MHKIIYILDYEIERVSLPVIIIISKQINNLPSLYILEQIQNTRNAIIFLKIKSNLYIFNNRDTCNFIK